MGGLSKTIPVVRSILTAGKRYCPHYSGWHWTGCITHALAAVGGDGILEVYINPNPLRTNGEMLTTTRNGVSWILPGPDRNLI